MVVRLFVDICLLRRNPQDVPASYPLLVISLIVYTGAGVILSLPAQTPAQALLTCDIDMLLMLLLVYLLLAARNSVARVLQKVFGDWMFSYQPVPNAVARWLQTCIAMSGTGAIFTLLAIPLNFSFDYPGMADSLKVLLSLLLISIYIWSLAVIAHILRHALSISYTAGILIALLYTIVVINVVNLFTPSGMS